MGSGAAAAGLCWAPPSSWPSPSARLGGPGLPGGSGAGFFFGSACTSAIHGGSFLQAGVLSDSLGVPLGFGTGGSCSLPFTRLLPPDSVLSCDRLERGRGVGGVRDVFSEAFRGAGVGRLAGGLVSSWGLLASWGLAGTWGRAWGPVLGLSTSSLASASGSGSTPSISLALASGCWFGCEGSPGLAPDRAPGPSLVHCLAQTKVPSSGPLW